MSKRSQNKSIGNKKSIVQSILIPLTRIDREIVKYSATVEWPDEGSRMHHERVMNMPPRKRSKAFEIVNSYAANGDGNSMHIFTYIDGDEFVPVPEDSSEMNRLARRIDSWRVYNSAIKQRKESRIIKSVLMYRT